jgi:voltage-gated potassium channel
VANSDRMDDRPEPSVVTRFVDRRVRAKGLRPRVAASVIATVWVIAIVVFGIVERLVDPDSFANVWLGMWWATQTVTTVGFGDFVPESTVGQLLAAVLMIGGLSFFAVITGMITSIFVSRSAGETKSAGEEELLQRLDLMSADLNALRDQVARQAPGAGPAS